MDMSLDGFVGNREILDDSQALRSLIVRLAALVGMTIVNGPTVHSFKEAGSSPDAGLSAFAIIAESHIAVHTWPKERYIMLDVVSCRDFDAGRALEFLSLFLDLGTTFKRINARRGPYPGVPTVHAPPFQFEHQV